MINNIKIEKAVPGDMPCILQLQKEAFFSEAELYNDFSFDAMVQTLESIQSDFNDYVFLKAVYNNRIIGSVKGRLSENSCYVGRLIVKPAYQNNGIGRLLMRSLEQEFNNVENYMLFTGSKSIKNILLYQSLGYKIIEEYADVNKSDLTLVKMIKENDNT